MYIRNLICYNYGPFKDLQEVEFKQDSPIILIQGSYTDNIKKSNRAGKSTLVEAILYLLFGSTRKSLKEIDLIHKGQSEMYVKGTFCIDGKDITITRGRNDKNVATFEVTGLDNNRKSDKQKDLEALIGYNEVDFCSVFFFKQNDMHFFMEQGPTDKKRLLQSWFKLDKWLLYEEKAKAKYIEYKNLAESNQRVKELLQNQFDSLIIEDSTLIDTKLQELNREKTINTSVLTDLQEQKNRLPNLSELLQQKTNTETELNIVKKKIENCNNSISLWGKKLQEREQTLNQKKHFEAELKLLPDKQTIESSINDLSKEYNNTCVELRITKDDLVKTERELSPFLKFNSICPVDNQFCDKGSRLPERKKALENAVQTHKTTIQELDNKTQEINENLQYKKEILQQIQALERQIHLNSLPDIDLHGLLQKEQTLLDDYKKQEVDLICKRANFDNVYKQNHNDLHKKLIENHIKELIKQNTLFDNEISINNIKLGQIQQAKKSKDQLLQKINELSAKILLDKQKEMQYNYITNMFGKEGIPSILIENNLSYLEENANLILSYISPNTKIEFSTTREVSSKESHCKYCGTPYKTNDIKCSNCNYGVKSNKLKDELNLKVYEGSRELAFNQDSGGGNALVTLALRIALSKLLSNEKPMEFLVIDEALSSFDPVRREEVTKLLLNTLSNIGGYKNIFIISHTDINDLGNFQTVNIVRNEVEDYSWIK
jgi:DNA repair exonuclease SbcCD ATPase subunit